MHGIDVSQLAHQLSLGVNNDLTKETYVIYAERLLETMVELTNLNDLLKEDILRDELVEMYSVLLPGVQVIPIVELHLADIRQAIKRCFWDPRCKVKLIKRKLNKKMYTAYFVMDLDATVLELISTSFPKDDYNFLEDVVDDNPSVELLSEYEERIDPIISKPTGTEPTGF